MLHSSPKEIHKHGNARFWRTICSFNLYRNTKYTVVENAADLIADMHSFFGCWPHMYSKRQNCSVNIHDKKNNFNQNVVARQPEDLGFVWREP